MASFLGMQPEYEALVVENELDFRSELIYFIESLDFGISVVAEASSFDDAKARLDRGDIDLLITDINLTDSPRFVVGDRDGIELAAYAKTRFGIPAIFLTAFADFDPAVFNMAAASEPIGFIQKNGEEIDSQTRDHIRLAVHRLEGIRRERENARQLADLSEHVGKAKLYVDDDGIVFDFNDEACELLERSPEDIANYHWEDVVRMSAPAPPTSHPLVRAFESDTQQLIPAVSIDLPNNGLFIGSVLVTPTEHMRRRCKMLLLHDRGRDAKDPDNWELIEGNCLIFIGTSPSLTENSLDLARDSRSAMLELQSAVLARFPSIMTATILQPKTLAVILDNTSEVAGHRLISTFIVDMEGILTKRHPGLKLHAGVAGIEGHRPVKEFVNGALSALEDAQRNPTKRVQSAELHRQIQFI